MEALTLCALSHEALREQLASDNMRVATEKMGLVEKTEYDVSFQNLVLQFKRSKEWTEKVVRGIEDLLLPDSSTKKEADSKKIIWASISF